MPFRPRHPRTLRAYAALLDHSVARIAELSADAREFDRNEIYRLADVWDNNSAALFAAATMRFRWARALQARWALRWMADFGNRRRSWVVERTAAAGVPVERFLRPPEPEPGAGVEPGRWHRHYWYLRAELSSEVSELPEGLAEEYDLSAAVFRGIMIERCGAERLEGWLEFDLPCRYGDGTGRAELVVRIEDPDELRLDSGRDTTGLSLRTGPDGVTLRVGEAGELRCRSMVLELDDEGWESSPTGRRFAAAHPKPRERRGVRQWFLPSLRSAGAPDNARLAVYCAMIAARRVRFPGAAAETDAPLRAVTTALAGAGQRILDAGAIRRRADRDVAFEALLADWCRLGGPDFVENISDRVPVPAELRAVGPRARPAVHALPSRLRLVRYRLPSPAVPAEYSHPAYVEFNFAQPPVNDPDAPWIIRVQGFQHPGTLVLTLDAFHRTTAPASTPTRLTFGPHLTATGTPDR
ncbi:hypothetical protein HUT16_14985 [Kitasatospora sp. NA04385]|uniref:hypothetical protein n=1 Tax=Kitasatospora sp. NA04385 TaxID=2742135 RepID=UPI001591FE7E|nr:hypothetical protein [Kitasatospora sp. NA04385]QKW20199.1 hypothetical protein HUT16_14985 [Kitasatospora sp. NA04385]